MDPQNLRMDRKGMDRQSRHNYRHWGKFRSAEVSVQVKICFVEKSSEEAAGDLLFQFERKRNLPKSRRARDHRLDSRRRHEAKS